VAKVSIVFFDRSYRFITATGRFIFQLPLDHNRVYEERIWQLFTAGAVQMEEDHSIFAAGSADHCSYSYSLFILSTGSFQPLITGCLFSGNP
jgi:hypothetical protein